MTRFFSACLVLFILATPALRGQQGTRPATAAGPTTTKTGVSLDTLINQGSDALEAGQFAAARESFMDAVSLDRNNAKALHGLAICSLQSKDMIRARDCFERALQASPRPPRALVMNAASYYQATRGSMRAVKLIKDYLTANPKELDEPMVNALGTALYSATASERKGRLYQDAAAFYMVVNQRLEAARPGYKRFGSEWVTTAESDTRTAAWMAKEKELAAQSDAVAAAEDKVADAERLIAELQSKLRWSRSAKVQLPGAEASLAQAQQALNQQIQTYDQMAAKVARPTFPKAIAMVSLDSTGPQPTAVAVATPVPPATTTSPTTTTAPATTAPTTTPTAVATANNIPAPAPVTPDPVKPVDPPVTPPTTTAPAIPTTAVATTVEPPRHGREGRRTRITRYAAAFAIAPDLVVTAASAIEEGATVQVQCGDGQTLNGKIVRKDATAGLALVKVEGRRLPTLPIADAFVPGAVTCPAYPTVDLFNPIAKVVRGAAQAPKDGAWTISLMTHPRLPGAPILNGNNHVIGVCIAPRDAEVAKLPAIQLDQLKAFAAADANPAARAMDPATAMVQLVVTRE